VALLYSNLSTDFHVIQPLKHRTKLVPVCENGQRLDVALELVYKNPQAFMHTTDLLGWVASQRKQSSPGTGVLRTVSATVKMETSHCNDPKGYGSQRRNDKSTNHARLTAGREVSPLTALLLSRG